MHLYGFGNMLDMCIWVVSAESKTIIISLSWVECKDSANVERIYRLIMDGKLDIYFHLLSHPWPLPHTGTHPHMPPYTAQLRDVQD